MFDDLADPSYAGPPPGARHAVATRARRIKRNRTIAVTSAMSSVALVAVAATALAPGGSTHRIEPLATNRATASRSPSATPSPSPSESPPTTTPSTPVRVAPPSPTASARARDLVGQWLGAGLIDTCGPGTSLRQGMTDSASLELTLDVPRTVDAAAPGMATLTITNVSDRDAHFSFRGVGRGPLYATMSDGAGTFTGAMTYDGTVDRPGENEHTRGAALDPGESQTELVPIVLDTCAARRDRARPGEPRLLAAGTYQMAVTIEIVDSTDWDRRATTEPAEPPPPSPSGPERYSSNVVTVRVR